MIQRIQTIWWLLSITTMVALIFTPLFFSPIILVETGKNLSVHGKDVNYIYGPLIGCMIFTGIAIAMFKNRKLQIALGYIAITNLLGVGFGIFVEYKGLVDVFPDVRVLPWAGLIVLAIIFQILAIRGVKSDEKLVRSMDRLR